MAVPSDRRRQSGLWRRRALAGAGLLVAAIAAWQALVGPEPEPPPKPQTEMLVVEPSRPTLAIAGGRFALEALVVRPAGAGPWPLAILSHGVPRDAAEYPQMRAEGMVGPARELARRGYAVVTFLRRGYGGSEGKPSRSGATCDKRDYRQSGLAEGADILAMSAHMQAQPWADPTRLLLVGQSAGGHASLAAASLRPAGLRAVVSMAGGRGSRAPDEVCDEAALVASMGAFGRTVTVPSLWVYAENDGYFRPALARAMHAAFAAGGSASELVVTPAFGEDGHAQFTRRAGIPVWQPIIDRFLRRAGLPTWDSPPLFEVARLPAPDGLSDACRRLWSEYLAAYEHKAFARTDRGACSYRAARLSSGDARDATLDACRQRNPAGCRIVSEDNRPP